MKQKYFGIIPSELYENNKLEDIITYLSGIEVCQRTTVESGTVELKKTNTLGEISARRSNYRVYESVRFRSDLVNKFYNFLLSHYKSGLGDYIVTNLELYEKTFGMTHDESKKIALNYFGDNYNKISIHPSFKYKFDENRNTIPATKFESLKRKRESLINTLGNDINLIIPYLGSDIDFFDRILFENNKTIKEIFQFENSLKILIEINNKYNFEVDNIFTPPAKSKIIFEEYSSLFHSLKQLEFIEQKLKDLENQNYAYVVSLFFFFKKKIKIKTPSAKLFGKIINDTFNFNFGEIKLSDPFNLKHQERLTKLHEDWN